MLYFTKIRARGDRSRLLNGHDLMIDENGSPENISDEELVHEIAALARLNIKEDEIKDYAVQMREILEHFEDLKEIDLEGIDPTVQINPLEIPLGPDMAEPGLARNAILSISNRRVDDVISVPRIINPEDETKPGK